MNYGDFQAKVSRALKRGSDFDDLIPDFTADAVRKLERRYSFQYMRELSEVAYNATTGAGVLELPRLTKSLRMVRTLTENGVFQELTKIDPRDMSGIAGPNAYGYWEVGADRVALNVLPTQDTTFQVLVIRYTDFSDSDSSEPYILLYHFDWLYYEVLRRFAMYFKDQAALLMTTAEAQDALQTLMDAERESEFDNAELVMGYGVNRF